MEGTDKLARVLFRHEGSTAAMPPADAGPAELQQRFILYGVFNSALKEQFVNWMASGRERA